VNLVAVIALAGLGAVFCVSAVRGNARLARIGVVAGAVFCLADWVLVEDLGFLGGLGTDPNSMIPFILLFTAGWLALTPAPLAASATVAATAEPATANAAATVTVPAAVSEATTAVTASAGEVAAKAAETVTGTAGQSAAQAARPETPAADTGGSGATPPVPPPASASRPVPSWLPAALHPERLRESLAAVSGRSVVALGAIGVILVGAAPMALASVNRNADPIIAEALAGASGQMDTPAPNFTLTSQDGRQVSLASLRGKVVLLTFLDPVCVTDCPIIAQEMRAADTLLGAKAANTELVAVVANPTYTSTAFTQAFTRQEGLDQVPNWLYLTGPLSRLQAVWHNYGIEVENLPAGAMSAHNDVAYVIDAAGTARKEISDDPGPGTGATKSSFASLLADSVLQTMGQGQ
jgi:cytochrome oxidase Cu insertion factor (SCO1/SenC/PrrC family)